MPGNLLRLVTSLHILLSLWTVMCMAQGQYEDMKLRSRCEKFSAFNPEKDPSTCEEKVTKEECESKRWCYWYAPSATTNMLQDIYFDGTPGTPKSAYELNRGEVLQVSPHVYQSTYSTETCSVIVTPTNKIIWVDTGFGSGVTAARYEAFRAAIGEDIFAPGNLAAIIYGEGHTEHINQTPLILSLFGQARCGTPCQPGQVSIIASTELVSYVQDIALVRAASMARGLKTLGQLVSKPNKTLGTYRDVYPYEPPSSILTMPTTFIPATPVSQPTTMTIAGTTLVFYPGQGDSRDALLIWYPLERVAFVNDIFFGSAVNIGTIRGESPRNPRIIVATLLQLANLAPNAIVTGHVGAFFTGPPFVRSPEQVQVMLRELYWLMDDLHKQTVEHMNAGIYDEETIARIVTPNLELHPYTQLNSLSGWCPLGYGSYQNIVRGIYAYYLGHFNGFAADLWSFTRDEVVDYFLELAGSPDHLLVIAYSHLRDRSDDVTKKMTSVAWALKLAGYVIHKELQLQSLNSEEYDSTTHDSALNVYSDSVRILGLNSDPLTWRYFYLTEWVDISTRKY